MYKSFIKSIFIYGFAGALGKFIGFFLMPIYVRIFSPEQYGIIDMIQTFIIVIAIFGMLLLESAVQRYFYEVKDVLLRKKYISTAFWTISVLSVIWLILISIFSKYISNLLFSVDEYYLPIIIASVTLPLFNLFVLSSVLIRYMKMPVTFMSIVLIQLLSNVGFTLWFVVYLKWGIVGVFYAQTLGLTLAFLASIYVVRVHLFLYFDKDILRRMFLFALPQFPSRIGSIANVHFNRFVMLGYLSLADIGIFTIAAKIASGFQLLENAFSMSWYPFFYEQLEKNKDHRIVFREITQYVFLLVFALLSLFIVFSKEILMVLTTKDYYGALPLIGLLALVNGLIIINNAVNLGTLITKKTIYGTYAYLASAALNIISLFILVPRIGLIGVPISLLICYFSLVMFSWITSEKLYYIGFQKFVFICSFVFTFVIMLITIKWDFSLLYKFLFAFVLIVTGILVFYKKVKQIAGLDINNTKIHD